MPKRSNQKHAYQERLKHSLGESSYSGCSAAPPLATHCQSRASQTNGTQPAPLSTDTNLSLGNLCGMAETRISVTARELSRKRSTPWRTWFACAPLPAYAVTAGPKASSPLYACA